MSRWIGAKLLFIWIVAIVRLPCGSRDLAITLPTDTPAIRTSASLASWLESGKAASNR